MVLLLYNNDDLKRRPRVIENSIVNGKQVSFQNISIKAILNVFAQNILVKHFGENNV